MIDVAATILDQAGIREQALAGSSMIGTAAVNPVRPFRYLYEGELYGVDISGSIYSPESFGEHLLIGRAAQDRSYQYGTLMNAGMIGSGGALPGIRLEQPGRSARLVQWTRSGSAAIDRPTRA